MIDGRAAPTPLRERVLAFCQAPAGRFAEWAFRDPAARAKRLAVSGVVYQAWAEGDAAAAQMVAAGRRRLMRAMRAMGERDSPPFSRPRSAAA